MVQRLQGEDSEAASEALEQFCRSYWFPLYAYVRRRGRAAQDAEDLPQAFFAQLLRRESLIKIDQESGRVRSYLLGAMKNFVNQAHRDAKALKRGGGVEVIPLDLSGAEERFGAEPAGPEGSEEDIFDREWADALLSRCLTRLRAFFEESDKLEVFEALKGGLMGSGDYNNDPALGERLGLGGDGVRGAVFRMRKRFRRYLEEEVRETVTDSSELDDEFAHLCRVLAEK